MASRARTAETDAAKDVRALRHLGPDRPVKPQARRPVGDPNAGQHDALLKRQEVSLDPSSQRLRPSERKGDDMIWLSLKLAAAGAGIALILYGAYIDGQRQKAKKRTLEHSRSH